LWCGYSHLHEECPEKRQEYSPSSCCNYTVIEGKKPHPSNYCGYSYVKEELQKDAESPQLGDTSFLFTQHQQFPSRK
jgi:hypothetical protein